MFYFQEVVFCLQGFGQKKQKPAENRRVCQKQRLLQRAGYFCHVRFLWRFALRRFRRLCFDILRRRFFFRFPMVK